MTDPAGVFHSQESICASAAAAKEVFFLNLAKPLPTNYETHPVNDSTHMTDPAGVFIHRRAYALAPRLQKKFSFLAWRSRCFGFAFGRARHSSGRARNSSGGWDMNTAGPSGRSRNSAAEAFLRRLRRRRFRGSFYIWVLFSMRALKERRGEVKAERRKVRYCLRV